MAKRRSWSKKSDGKWYSINGDPTWDSWFKRALISLGLFGGKA